MQPFRVYVIGPDGGPWKVGISRRPMSRLAGLQTASPRLLRIRYEAFPPNQPERIEYAAHRLLERYRLQGEWFRCPLDVAIKAIKRAIWEGPPDGEIPWQYAKLSAGVVRSHGTSKHPTDGPRPRWKMSKRVLRERQALAEREWQLREWFGRSAKGTLDS